MSFLKQLGNTWWEISVGDQCGYHYHATLPATQASAMIVAMRHMSLMDNIQAWVVIGKTCRALHQQLSMVLTMMHNCHKRLFVKSGHARPGPRACSTCGGYSLQRCSRRFHLCEDCDQPTCEDCVTLSKHSWQCVGCPLENEIPQCDSMRMWLIDELDEVMYDLYEKYDVKFDFNLITLAGEVVRDEQRRQVAPVHTSWASSFGCTWDSVYYYTRGRVQRMIIGNCMVTPDNKHDLRWSDAISRTDVETGSMTYPLHVTVILRDWW